VEQRLQLTHEPPRAGAKRSRDAGGGEEAAAEAAAEAAGGEEGSRKRARPPSHRRPWSEEEEEALVQHAAASGGAPVQWGPFAERSGRTEIACQQRWKRMRVGQSGGVVALGEARLKQHARTVPRTKHKATPLALPAPAAAIATTAAADAGASPVAGGWGGGGDGGGGGGGLPFVARDHIGELRAKLTQHGLEAYLERCLAEGFDDLHFLKTMPREEAAF